MNAKRTTQPYTQAEAVTPSNDTDLANPCRALYVGGASSGDLSVVMAGVTVVFNDLVPGTILPIVATRVRATGTTVTDIIALN